MSAHFVLIGGNRRQEDGPLLALALSLRAEGHRVSVLTEQLHMGMPTADGRPLSERLAEAGFEPMVIEFITAEAVAQLVGPQSWGLLLNAVWLIPVAVIEAFGGRLFNYHNARLPEERGAAAYSWKILRGARDGALTIHDVAAKFDTGDLRMVYELSFPESCRTPAEFYDHLGPAEMEFLKEWAARCAAGDAFPPTRQDESGSFYWPRLNTMANGWVDWAWSADEIVRFIHAFDDPHEGASTLLDGARVHLKRAELGSDSGFHPFQAGIVFRRHDGCLHVAARGGSVVIGSLADENDADLLAKLRLGSRLHTPRQTLDDALAARPVHTHDRVQIK